MQSATPLAETYQLLLSELAQRLRATCGELLLCPDAGQPPTIVARYAAAAAAERLHWIELPLGSETLEVGRLRLGFAADAPLPGPGERGIALSLLELAAWLHGERDVASWDTLHQAGRRILAVTEEELQRMILDIHDGPVQKLFVVSSHLALLQAQVAEGSADPAALLQALERLGELVGSALHEIKTTLSMIRPAEFQRRALPAVLHGLAMQHEAMTGNQVDLQIEGDIPLVSLATKIALYRVLQESLANAFRHAGVDRHEVHLRSQRGWVELEVIDEGRGFDPPPLDGPRATEREEHIGLRGMRERMHLVGGQLRVLSQPGQGTRVIVKVPSDV